MLRIKILVYVELGLAREGSVVCPDICDICEFLPTATTPELATPTPTEDEAITTLLDDVSTPPAELATSPPTPRLGSAQLRSIPCCPCVASKSIFGALGTYSSH